MKMLVRCSCALALALLLPLPGPAEEPAPPSSREKALEQFRKLSPKERLKSVEKGARPGPVFVPVKRGHLLAALAARGSLDSAEASDVICRVKGKGDGKISTTIRWVVENGDVVKKGDRLIELDASEFRKQLAQQKIVLEKAKFEAEFAENALRLARAEGELDSKDAEIKLLRARINLKKIPAKDKDEKEVATAELERAQLILVKARLQARARDMLAETEHKVRAALVVRESAQWQTPRRTSATVS